MIHALQRPASYTDLRNTLVFQRRLLELVLDPATVIPLTEPALTAYFAPVGAATGAWIAQKKGTLCADIENAIRAAKRERRRAKSLVTEFDNDVNFDANLSNSAFVFKFHTPKTRLEKAVTVLMKNLYEEVFKSGFSYGGATNLSRQEFIIDFVSMNASIDVCPVCDRSNDDLNRNGIPPHTVDHFHPKAIYPFLSVHPANFLPACHRCNSVYKTTKNPLLSTENLTDVCHPFDNTLSHNLETQISRDATQSIVVSLTEVTFGRTSRIQNLIRLFDLEQRWQSRRLPKVQKAIQDELLRYRRKHPKSALKDIKQMIDYMQNDARRDVGKEEGGVVKIAFLRYLSASDPEMKKIASLP